MKVYIAAPYAAREQVALYLTELAAIGFEPVCRWADGTHEIGPTGPATSAPLADRQRWASEDLDDVRAAQIVVSLTRAVVDIPDGSGVSGGRHVETGAALALRKRVLLVGEPENVFHWLDQVDRAVDWHAAVVHLAHLLVQQPRRRKKREPAPVVVDASPEHVEGLSDVVSYPSDLVTEG